MLYGVPGIFSLKPKYFTFISFINNPIRCSLQALDGELDWVVSYQIIESEMDQIEETSIIFLILHILQSLAFRIIVKK